MHCDRCRPFRRLHRDGRSEQPRRRRDGAAAGARNVCTEQRALQGVHDRRGAPAVVACFQRDAEDARRAARIRQVHSRDDRSAESTGHGAVALPAVQLKADDAGRHRRAYDANTIGRKNRSRAFGAARTGACGARQHARRFIPARSGDRVRRRLDHARRGARDVGSDRSRHADKASRYDRRARRGSVSGDCRSNERAQCVVCTGDAGPGELAA